MDPLSISKLSTQEIVERFLTTQRGYRYAYDFVHRPDCPTEIRKYIEKQSGSEKKIWFANFAGISDFADNDVICDLMNEVLSTWSASFSADEIQGCFATFLLAGKVPCPVSSIATYLGEIAYYVSRDHKRIYASYDPQGRGDNMLVERMRGAQHLHFLAQHLNERFDNPTYIEQWNIVFTHYFKKRKTHAEVPIVVLFCLYMLESENVKPRLPFYDEDIGTAFKLSLPVIRFICVNGLIAIRRRNLWAGDLYGRADLGATFYNVIKNIWRYRLYEDFSEKEYENFKDALILYPCFASWVDMQEFLENGDEKFIHLAISAWDELFKRNAEIIAANRARDERGWANLFEAPRELVVANKCMEEHLPKIREFLLSIPSSKVSSCQSEWEEMQQYIMSSQ